MKLTRRECIERGIRAGASLLAAAAAQRGFGQAGTAKASPEESRAAPGGPDGGQSLKAHAAARGIAVGAAVDINLLRHDLLYRATLARQYSMVVAENCMKWQGVHPAPDRYTFDDADALVQFAEEHGMKVRGHNLGWHESVPRWVGATVTRENAEKVLTDHILTVAGRYKGRIHSWDVVNEAIWLPDGREDGLRSSSPWFQLLGPRYLEIAYRAARQADPHALLTYNDYGIEYDLPQEQKKRAAVARLLRRMKAAQIPIDAVGIQSHLNTGNLDRLGDGIRRFAGEMGGMGLQVFLTEMDVNGDSLPDEDIARQDRDIAAAYRSYLDSMLRESAVKAVLTWGISDAHTWLNGPTRRPKHPTRAQRPLPFDSGYRPAPAFFALRDAFDYAPRR